MLQSIWFKFYVNFRLICFIHTTDKLGLSRNEKLNWENCGTETTRLNLARDNKRCFAGSLTYSSRTNFSTKSRAETNYHIAKKHSKATARVVQECKICGKNFHSFYNLPEHKRNEHGAQRSSGAQNLDVAHVMGDVDDNSLKEELETWNTFWLKLIWRMGDTESKLCHGYSGLEMSVGTARCCV